MKVFVDTSALFGLLDEDDTNHTRLMTAFASLETATLVTHNYVVVETAAQVARRLPTTLVGRLLLDVLGPMEIAWVDEATHQAAVGAYLAAGPTAPSLVDFTSFEVMRRQAIRTALAVDPEFVDAGFEVVPGA